MKFVITLALPVLITLSAYAQKYEEPMLPYYEIPNYPDSYSAGNVAARMVDGLGFRYYWATDGLRNEDLAFIPGEGARSSEETLDHILSLSKGILNATKKTANEGAGDFSSMSLEQKRKETLYNLKEASDILKKSSDTDLENYKVIFKRGDNSVEYPFWNLLNGQVADALWHVGQIVSFRRSSGNPFNPKVSVFAGQLRN